jgi:hypothetical protein
VGTDPNAPLSLGPRSRASDENGGRHRVIENAKQTLRLMKTLTPKAFAEVTEIHESVAELSREFHSRVNASREAFDSVESALIARAQNLVAVVEDETRSPPRLPHS